MYDPFEGNYKRIQIIDGQPYFDEFSSIENIVFREPEPGEEEEKKDRSRPMFGLDMDDPIA